MHIFTKMFLWPVHHCNFLLWKHSEFLQVWDVGTPGFVKQVTPLKNLVYFYLNSPFQQKEVRWEAPQDISLSSAKISSRIRRDLNPVLVEGRICLWREGCVYPAPAVLMSRLWYYHWWDPAGMREWGLGNVRREFKGKQTSTGLLLRE